jgi:hypothetical protein
MGAIDKPYANGTFINRALGRLINSTRPFGVDGRISHEGDGAQQEFCRSWSE